MAGFELMGKEEQEAVNEVFEKGGGVLFRTGFEEMRNGMYKVAEFEKEFAEKFNVKYALAVSSGTAALLCALKALNIRPGDEVITQSFTFVATVEAIIEARAIPIITEINKTLNMDPEDLRAKITDKTRAIIPVHMLGAPAQMEEILAIAREKNIPVLEDTAQAPGARYQDKNLGTTGRVGIFSFDFGKALTTGEGGMVVTDDEEIFLRVREYSDHGHQDNPNFPRGKDTRRMSGFNYKMTELQGAIGLVQLKKLDYGINHQRENEAKIREGIKNIPGIEFRQLADREGKLPGCLVFFVEDANKAERFAQKLEENGLGTDILPSAVDWHFSGTWNHMLPQFIEYQNKDLEKLWEESGNLLRRAISLPIGIKMDEAQINKAIETIKKVAKEVL